MQRLRKDTGGEEKTTSINPTAWLIYQDHTARQALLQSSKERRALPQSADQALGAVAPSGSADTGAWALAGPWAAGMNLGGTMSILYTQGSTREAHMLWKWKHFGGVQIDQLALTFSPK
jgi:hypothetical protein